VASASVSANSEALERLQQILVDELTEQQRAALYAVYLRSIPVQEAARRMGASRNVLYDLLPDARLRFKHRLEREGWDPDELQGTIL
jgi:DNA-directed RNA polymerase specialized sigma24 family protein